MNQLFNMEPSLSPRLEWMARNGVMTGQIRPTEWIAWDAGNRGGVNGWYADKKWAGFGDTEIEAIEDLADKIGAVNWVDKEDLKSLPAINDAKEEL